MIHHLTLHFPVAPYPNTPLHFHDTSLHVSTNTWIINRPTSCLFLGTHKSRTNKLETWALILFALQKKGADVFF